MRIGVLGGTFNPIHNGHIELARAAMDYCGLDRVWVMPAGNPYMKNAGEILDGDNRLRMIELAIEDIPGFMTCTRELNDQNPTYSYMTFEGLKADYPEDSFFFILGADSIFNLERWKEPGRLCAACEFIVSARELPDMKALEDKCNELKERLGAVIHVLPYMDIRISSSDIRNRLHQGLDVSSMLPDKVYDYIEEKGFYR